MFNLAVSSSIFLIGIGGVGMTPLALLLKQMGFHIAGSDIQPFRMASILQQHGITVYSSHEAIHAQESQLVIYSTAIPKQNPEFVYAQQNNIPCMSRIEAVSHIVQQKKMLSITGSYGKSSTTAFCSSFANFSGLDPSYLIGADLTDYNPANWNPHSEWFIFETDESRPEFLVFMPYGTILTNIGKDHLQNYQHDSNQLKQKLCRFLANTNSAGPVVVSESVYTECRDQLKTLKNAVLKCGAGNNCDYRYDIQQIEFKHDHFETTFHLWMKNERFHSLLLPMPGEKFLLDAVMAFALISEVSAFSVSPDYFRQLPVLDRRFQFKRQIQSSLLFDDEGDSPDVIEDVLRLAKKLFPSYRLIPIVQPHRFSRLQNLMHAYGLALSNTADDIILMPVFSAGEVPIPAIDSEHLEKHIMSLGFTGNIFQTHHHDECAAKIKYLSTTGQYVFILFGPGDVWLVENAL